MAEALKNHFGPDVPVRLRELVEGVHPGFDGEGFLSAALEGFEKLELTERARHISAALAETLPADRKKAIEVLMAAVRSEGPEVALTGMESFLYLPLVYFVAEQGLGCFEVSMQAQKELTKKFTAEFSIRTYLDHFPEKTLARLRVWAGDSDVHVRRLVSEGTRPRLPWANRLKRFQDDPEPVLELLELLKDDPEEYVRRSVANNLNDISKDNPGIAVEVANRWWYGASDDRKRLIRHGLRTLVKQGHPDALAVLGFTTDTPARVEKISVRPTQVEIGGKVSIEVSINNPSDATIGVLVDLRVHFVKANGSTSPKVFKGAELRIPAGQRATVRKTVSVAQHSTRKHYPGTHAVEIVLNGGIHPGAEFEVL